MQRTLASAHCAATSAPHRHVANNLAVTIGAVRLRNHVEIIRSALVATAGVGDGGAVRILRVVAIRVATPSLLSVALIFVVARGTGFEHHIAASVALLLFAVVVGALRSFEVEDRLGSRIRGMTRLESHYPDNMVDRWLFFNRKRLGIHKGSDCRKQK